MIPVDLSMITSEISTLILCGGRGKRLQSRTSQTPKVLIPVNGKPVLDYILGHFLEQKFKNFVFATGYLSDKVEEYLAARQCEHGEGLSFSISNAGESASMLMRLASVRKFLKDQVIVSYGDTFIDIDYQDLLSRHRQSECPVTIVTGQIKNPFGVVQLAANDRVTSFVEKPVYNHYIGCFVFDQKILDEVTEADLNLPDGEGLVKLFQTLAQQQRLAAFRHRGLQITFNTEQELEAANTQLNDYYTVREN